VVWTVINEVFPANIRGRGVALATAINWGSAYLVSQFFLSLVDGIGSAMTFWLLAVFCVIGWIWIHFRVPETKGLSLEKPSDVGGEALIPDRAPVSVFPALMPVQIILTR
jgi:MFS family permease